MKPWPEISEVDKSRPEVPKWSRETAFALHWNVAPARTGFTHFWCLCVCWGTGPPSDCYQKLFCGGAYVRSFFLFAFFSGALRPGFCWGGSGYGSSFYVEFLGVRRHFHVGGGSRAKGRRRFFGIQGGRGSRRGKCAISCERKWICPMQQRSPFLTGKAKRS